MKLKNYVVLCLASVTSSVFADLPLSLEELLTDKGKWKLETSINYVNSESQKAQLSSPALVQVSNASFISVPTEIDEKPQNSDVLVGTIGLRYGLTGNTDLYVNSSYLWKEERYFDDEKSKQRSKSLSDVSLGINHQLMLQLDLMFQVKKMPKQD